MTALALQRRALQVMEQALDQPEAARRRWLERECGGDTHLIQAVTKLLSADAFGSEILPTQPPEPAEWIEMEPPERIGPYRLTRRLGQGGMGEVFLGERDDGVFQQQVAVKLLRPSLFPTASARYFDSERRLLASLRHPGIARILDGGVEPGGRPYFIMELVEGEAIDAHVAARDLSAMEVAGLVRRLCHAVQHAHQALVVHADIKPSNVHVDETGAPRLLDFGIACLADEPDEDGAPAAFPITPAYASPQRLEGGRPTTSDDIFALGALLRRLAGDEAPEDLAAIIARATHPDAAVRYATAAALADDLDRWTEHRPVQARRQTWTYVFSRFLVRRRWMSTGVAAAALLLIGATAVISGLYVEARAARADAETRFTDARHMARYLLFDVYDRLSQTPQSLPVRRDVARVGQGYLVGLSEDPRAPADVRLEAVEGLVRLASIQADGRRSLGQAAQGRASLTRAQAMIEALARSEPRRPDIALTAARIHLAEARLALFNGNNTAEARRAVDRAVAEINRAAANGPDPTAIALVQLRLHVSRSQLLNGEGRYPQAVAEGQAGLAVWRGLAPAQRTARDTSLLVSSAYEAMADAIYYGGNPAGAEAPYRAELALLEDALRGRPEDPELIFGAAWAHYNLGSTLLQVGRHREGLAALQPGLALAERLAAFDRSDAMARRLHGSLSSMIGQGLSGAGRHAEAIEALGRVVGARRTAALAPLAEPQDRRDLATALTALADANAAAGQRPQACQVYRQGQAVFADMDRRGVVARMDRDYALRLLTEGMSRACGSPRPEQPR